MRKTLLLFSLLWTISSLGGGDQGAYACTVIVSVTGGTSFPTGTQINLTSAISGTCSPISQVSYYNGGALLGSSTVGPSYSFTWNTIGMAAGTYNDIYAVASSSSIAASGGTAIDIVGSLSLGANPAVNTVFGSNGSIWQPGDSQICSATAPYNEGDDLEDGACEDSPAPNFTNDSLDNTMHILSDFVVFANTMLSKSPGTLSTSLQTWLPQANSWVSPTCDDGSTCTVNSSTSVSYCADGTYCDRLAPVVTNLNAWYPVITSWLAINYQSAGAWCVPAGGTTGFAAEDSYINGGGAWGSLGSVIACENYNATYPVNNYQACLNLLQGSCPASVTGTACDPATLGRSLTTQPAPAFDGCSANFATWVQNSLTLATNAAAKFKLRSLFLTDLYNRAVTMQTIFSQGANALQNFLNGAGAQLANAQAENSVTQTLPNAVIYGWQDDPPIGGSGGCINNNGTRVGCAHIVKVLAYSTARCGTGPACISGGGVIDSLLPWVKTTTKTGFLGLPTERDYTLTDRDGFVYVSVRRWDQDHANPNSTSKSILFPNGRPLWQFTFENPKGTPTSGTGLIGSCQQLQVPGTPYTVGYGLSDTTLSGLGYMSSVGQLLSQDVNIGGTGRLQTAFMLNDNIGGTVDPNSGSGGYGACLNAIVPLLIDAPQSQACAQYIASNVASGPSGNQSDDTDYSVKFVACTDTSCPCGPNGLPPQDDLTGD